MYVVDGYGAEIRVIDAAAGVETTLAVADLPAPSEEEAWAALEPGLQERAEYSEFARILLEQLQGGEVPRDGQVPTIAGMLADDAGMLWIKEFEPATDALWLRANARRPGPGGHWRVLAPETGELVAEVPMPAGVVPIQIGADRLLGLAVDELGVQRVVEHAVVRGS